MLVTDIIANNSRLPRILLFLHPIWNSIYRQKTQIPKQEQV